ncbi:MAG: BatA domain-containing protein [Planctomycetota bacterium]|nr:BatA domain-containing protein [Planctomycetota bacterium]MDA1200243.1 BatA domain-containing protein [Planctomycetota bacterium]
MPAFDFTTLFWWGLPLAAAPLVIHLINLLRHRRVPWAAMEFLLASQKKYRSRVLLRQLLLLLLRTVAVAGLVVALAQPRWQAAPGGLFGGGGMHLVLIDDSYSMGDTAASEPGGGRQTAFDRGLEAADAILAGTVGGEAGTLAVGLFSELTRGELAIPATTVDPATRQQIRDRVGSLPCSWLATKPREPLERAAAVAAAADGPCTLWLISDFRRCDWQDEEAADGLRRLAEAGVGIRLIDAAEPAASAGNLSLTRLEAVGGVPAAGVRVPIELAIRNDGDTEVRDVRVSLREDDGTRPGLRIAVIPAGGTATARFDARFQTVGDHLVTARLPSDRLAADNDRSCVIDVVDQIDVLVVSDDPAAGSPGSDAFYVANALAPGGAAATGLRPRIVPASSLGAIDLEPYDCLWLLDVERFEAAAVTALEQHATAGGGVVFFTGPRTEAALITRDLHRAGDGLFPVPLAGGVEILPAPGGDRVPDLVAEDHPVVTVLAGRRNPLLDMVRVERVMAVERTFDEAAAPGLRRLLSLRDGRPLILEKPFGDGLVAVVLSPAAPIWNTWARGNPSWVVVMLELQNHLARRRRQVASLTVGRELTVPLVPGRDEIEVDFLVPPDAALVRQTALTRPDGGLEARLPTRVPGGYAARWRRADGSEHEKLVAVNVNPEEGLLEPAGREQLDRQLAGIDFRYDTAAGLAPADSGLAGVPLAMPLLVGLLGVLALEQLAALAASYHPVRPARRSILRR